MDTFKINPLFFLVFPFLLFSNFSFASIVDLAGSGATWLRDTNSENLMKLTPNSSAVLSGNNLTLVEKINIPTSKGSFAVDLVRNASVDLSRLGKAASGFARSVGPVGMALTTASLVCELTSICNQAGEWMLQQIDFGGISAGHYPTCQEAIGLSAGESFPACDTVTNQYPNVQWFRAPANPPANAGCINRGGVGWIHSANAFDCSTPPVVTAPVSESDWATAETKMNDPRFIQPLLDKQYPVPVQAPSITIPQKFPIGNQTTTLKDGNGNTTGTQTTTTEAEITTPSAAENPSGSPSVIRITETSITNNYNINNELTSSTTTTTGGTEKPQQQSYEIEIDNVNPDTLQEKPVSFPFDTNSWGSGSCPADRTVNYHYGSLNLTFQPACDFATGIKPIVLILAGFVAMYIISGAVRDA